MCYFEKYYEWVNKFGARLVRFYMQEYKIAV